ncbi:MAG: YggS family pyridoxal phosphate-dependent enzyme [Duodenibacillus sp.]
MTVMAARLAAVRLALEGANRLYGRATQLMAVGKTFGPEALLLVAQAGQRIFGENYAQEGCDKVDWFAAHHPEIALEWHFIGPLQANKTRPVAERFDWVDSIDRMRIARRLNDQRPQDKGPLNVLIEVNIDDEESKSGIRPEDLADFARELVTLPNLRVRGLMAIPAPADTPEAQKMPLAAMRALFDAHKEAFGWDTLSMGMSADMVCAVECGSTLVRVGSAIFGARDYSKKASA